MICSRCASNFESSGSILGCPVCGSVTILSDSSLSPVDQQINAWESTAFKSQPVEAFFATTKSIFYKAERFFASLQPSKQLLLSLLYGITAAGIGLAASAVWSRFIPSLATTLLTESEIIQNESASTLIASPFLTLLEIIILSFYAHVAFLLSKKKPNSFSLTIKTLSYTQAAMLFEVIPFIGSFLALVYWVYFLLTSFHVQHQISRMRALWILLAPILILFAVSMILAMFALMLGLSSMGIFNAIGS